METTNHTISAIRPDAVLSPELKAALFKYQDHYEIVNKEAIEIAAEMGYSQNRVANAKRLDLRYFGAMVNHESWMTDEMVKQNAQEFARDFMGDQREKRLNEFYDRIDSIDIAQLDYSCLTEPNPPKREAKGLLTKSEHDMYKLLTALRADQAVNDHMKDYPEYMDIRYPSWDAKKEFEWKRDLMTNGFQTYLTMVLLANNDLSSGFREISGAKNATEQFEFTVLAPAFACFAYSQKMAILKGEPYNQSLKFKIPDCFSDRLYHLYHEQDGNASAASLQFADDFLEQTLKVIWKDDTMETSMKQFNLGLGDLVFVEGESLSERIDKKFPDLSPDEREKRIKIEAIKVLLKGEEHVDIARFQTNERGDYSLHISTLEPDLHALDQHEIQREHSAFHRAFDFGLSKIKTRADRADELQKNDKDRSKRYGDVRSGIYNKIGKAINQNEYDKKRQADQIRMKEGVEARQRSIKANDAAFFGWLADPNGAAEYTPEVEAALCERVPKAFEIRISPEDREALKINTEIYAPVVVIQRPDSRGSVVSLYAMTQGMTLDEVLSTDPSLNEEKTAIGKRFVEEFKILGKEEFLQRNGADADYRTYFEQRRQEIGKLYETLHEQFTNLPSAPFLDTSIEGIAENYKKLDFIASCAQNINQTVNPDIRSQYVKDSKELDEQRTVIAGTAKSLTYYADFLSEERYINPDYERDKTRVQTISGYKEIFEKVPEKCQGTETVWEMKDRLGGLSWYSYMIEQHTSRAQIETMEGAFEHQLRYLHTDVAMEDTKKHPVDWDGLNKKEAQTSQAVRSQSQARTNSHEMPEVQKQKLGK